MPKKKKVDPRAIKASLRMKKAKPRFSTRQIEKMQQRAIALYHKHEDDASAVGDALIAVKKSISHGEFKKWLAENKIDRNRASYCMRIAQGKVAAAKHKYAKTPEQQAVRKITKEVSEFVKAVRSTEVKTLDQVGIRMTNLFVRMVNGVSKLRNWPLSDPENQQNFEKYQRAKNKFEGALNEFLNIAFVPVSLDELDHLTNADMPRISDYLAEKKRLAQIQPPPTTTSAAAGTATT